MITRKIPYCCPVCNGAGIVKADLYNPFNSVSVAYETCHSCNGTGIVYGEEIDTNGFKIESEEVQNSIQFF